MKTPLETLKHHVTGAIERGEAVAVAGIEAPKDMTKQDKARAFQKTSRQYNTYSIMYGTVEKTFNRGAGSLKLYRFGDGNRVSVNTRLEKPADRARLMAVFPAAVVVESPLGYPDWYTRGLIDPDKVDGGAI
jgi:hypothetical protein